MEALKPAQVVGVKVNEEEKSALVVVKDDSLSLAIGRKGVNARLAVKLTGYKIDIKTESEALEAGLEYSSFEEINALELQEKADRIAKAQRETLVYPSNFSLPGAPEGYVAPQERNYDEESNDFDSALEEYVDKEEAAPLKEEQPAPVSSFEEKEEEEAPAVEEAVAPAPVEEKKEEVKVKTTTTIEDLEKSLEASNKDNKKNKTNKRKKKVEEEEEEDVVVHNDSPRMSIYTEEELRELEEEENEEIDDDEDIDYDEYDDYYDEN